MHCHPARQLAFLDQPSYAVSLLMFSIEPELAVASDQTTGPEVTRAQLWAMLWRRSIWVDVFPETINPGFPFVDSFRQLTSFIG
jgi:hypothetical protein